MHVPLAEYARGTCIWQGVQKLTESRIKLPILTRLEIEDRHEWKVLLTNDPNVMGPLLIDGLIRLIYHKTNIDSSVIKQYYQETISDE